MLPGGAGATHVARVWETISDTHHKLIFMQLGHTPTAHLPPCNVLFSSCPLSPPIPSHQPMPPILPQSISVSLPLFFLPRATPSLPWTPPPAPPPHPVLPLEIHPFPLHISPSPSTTRLPLSPTLVLSPGFLLLSPSHPAMPPPSPWRPLPVEVGDQLVLIVAHPGPEVRDADVRLFGPAQIRLRDQHVTHREHAQPAQLLKHVTTACQ